MIQLPYGIYGILPYLAPEILNGGNGRGQHHYISGFQQKSDDDKEHPVAFLSRTLNKLEQKYHSTELECLAVKWAVEKLSHYLKGRKFTIISDYKNLKWWFNNFKDDKSRRARWRIFMQQYDFDVEYKKGVENKVADALSRAQYE